MDPSTDPSAQIAQIVCQQRAAQFGRLVDSLAHRQGETQHGGTAPFSGLSILSTADLIPKHLLGRHYVHENPSPFSLVQAKEVKVYLGVMYTPPARQQYHHNTHNTMQGRYHMTCSQRFFFGTVFCFAACENAIF